MVSLYAIKSHYYTSAIIPFPSARLTTSVTGPVRFNERDRAVGATIGDSLFPFVLVREPARVKTVLSVSKSRSVESLSCDTA